jgi:hypothetical protein
LDYTNSRIALNSNRDEKHVNIATHIPEHYGLVESKQDSVRDKCVRLSEESMRESCVESAKIVLNKESGKADFEGMKCHGIQGIDDGTHGRLHSEKSVEPAMDTLKKDSGKVEIKCHEGNGTCKRLHTEEHRETEGEVCVQMIESNRKEGVDCIEPAKSTTKIKCCDEQQQQPAVTKPSEASSSSQPIAADDINHLPNEPVRDYELVETDNNHADNGKVRRIEPGGSIEPKSESSDENEEHSNGQEEEQKSNAVKLESNVIFAARDIRYYPQDSSTPQEYGWTNNREKFRRDGKVTEAEMKQNQTLFVRNLSYKVNLF